MRSIDKGMYRIYIVIAVLFFISCENEDFSGAADEYEPFFEFPNGIRVKKSMKEIKNDNNINNDLRYYKWISGTWVDTSTFRYYKPSGHYVEKWLVYEDSISGKGFKVIENDTTMTRLMSIRNLNNGPVFIERELGHSMVSYYFLGKDSASFSFTNEAQAFPRDITYFQKGKDSMAIVLKGISGQFDREIVMQFKKVDF